jgi:hypothetical protein
MADEIDLANERAEIERMAAVSMHAARPQRQGLERCAICDEPISDFRQALGAIHCVEHATEAERRRAGYGR